MAADRPMTLPRFYVPGLDPAAREAQLPPGESHHLLRVLRLGLAAEVSVFDGRGREVRARVTSAAPAGVRVEVLAPLSPAREAAVPLTLVQAVLKGDKMDDVVRDATMMGVAAIEPIVTDRTIVKPQALQGGRATERWRRVAIASVKQCRRAVVPEIGEGVRFDAWLQRGYDGVKVLLVEPSAIAHAADTVHHFAGRPRPSSIAVIVGPEGGWTEDERRAAIAAGCVPITLGEITFRADAMALCALAIIRFAFDDL